MKDVLCMVHFHYFVNGKEIKPKFKKPEQKNIVEQEFMHYWNVAANIANNGVIDLINKKWSELHPDKEVFDENADNSEYYKFFAKEYDKRICEPFNNAFKRSNLIFFCDETEGIFSAKLKCDPRVSMNFTIKLKE